MSRRPPAALALAALVLAVSGCGGGDPGAFAGATDRTCRGVATAVTLLRQDLVRTGNETESAAIADAVNAYATKIDAAATAFAEADPPGSGEKEFRDKAVDGLRQHARKIRAAAEQGRSGRLDAALARELQQAGPSAMPDIPGAVLDDAPSCRASIR